MPIQIQTPTGIVEFPDGMADADIERVLAADHAAPMASHAAQAPESGRTWADTAVDALPLLGGLVGGVAGAGLGPLAIGTAAIGGAGGEGFRRAINDLRGKGKPAEETPAAVLEGVGKAGLDAGVGQAVGMGASAGLRLAAKGAMRGALGAQAKIRAKFPTVNLEDVALREGVGLPGANIPAKALASHQAVSAAGRAADEAGAAKVQPREMVKGLRKLYDKAGQARRPDAQRGIVEAANEARKTFRGGLGVEDALAVKSDMAAQAGDVMQGAANPRAASTAKKVLGSMSRETGNAAKGRGEGVAQALTRSQEMMALDKALASMSGPSGLRMIVSGASGVGSGVSSGDPMKGLAGAASTYALTSPQWLSLLAQLLSKGAPASKAGTRALVQLLLSHEDQ